MKTLNATLLLTAVGMTLLATPVLAQDRYDYQVQPQVQAPFAGPFGYPRQSDSGYAGPSGE